MSISLSIDRFEGSRKEIAVLVTDDGCSILVPRRLLPKGVKAGELLSMTLDRDVEGTAELLRRAKAVRDDLEKTDPGGDIKL
ncbi:DUF3006 domain-containing protein [Tundrisphaera lichenicola]|uniref:DUF3006 domain-containing protein n=1 Tax=Tundrisphaera lichenicola TaxID=2029860 RepID=UPI003EBDBB34